MANTTKVMDVEVGYDAEFTDRLTHALKYVWIAIGLLLAAGLAGFLGRGPLAKSTISSSPGGLQVNYERIARNKTPAVMEITVPSNGDPNKTIRLHLEGDLVNRGKLQRLIPPPVRTEPTSNGLIAEWPQEAGSVPQKVVLTHEPGSPGQLRYKVAVENGAWVQFNQLVLP